MSASSCPRQLIKVPSGSSWDAPCWAPAPGASLPCMAGRSPHPSLPLTPVRLGCQLGLPRVSGLRPTPASCPHSQPPFVTSLGPWRRSTEKSAPGQLSGGAKWACCPSGAKEEEEKSNAIMFK